MTPPKLMASDERGNALTRIVVIGMADAVAPRLEDAARSVSVNLYPAHSGLHPALKYDEKEAISAWGRPLLAGELAAYSSHYSAWQDLASGDAKQYVVLAGDIVVDWTFLGKLAEVDLTAMGIHYLRLNHRYPVASRIVKENFVEPDRFVLELKGLAVGATAYAITKVGASGFLDRCRTVVRPVADELGRVGSSRRYRNLSIFPPAVLEASEELNLCDTPSDAESKLRRATTSCWHLGRAARSVFARRWQRTP